MRPGPLLWFTISVVCFVGAYYCWRVGERWGGARVGAGAGGVPASVVTGASGRVSAAACLLPQLTGELVARLGASGAGTNGSALAYRLRNTDLPMKELVRREHALLLENALLDTERPVALALPEGLRAKGEPGSYVVQARGALDDAFRARLRAVGAAVVSYIPNQAYLVRASAAAAAVSWADGDLF